MEIAILFTDQKPHIEDVLITLSCHIYLGLGFKVSLKMHI